MSDGGMTACDWGLLVVGLMQVANCLWTMVLTGAIMRLENKLKVAS